MGTVGDLRSCTLVRQTGAMALPPTNDDIKQVIRLTTQTNVHVRT